VTRGFAFFGAGVQPAWGYAVSRSARVRAGGLAGTSIIAVGSRRAAWRALAVLACGCSLWSAGLTLTIGVAIDARQPALAQEKQTGPSSYGKPTKEERKKERERLFKFAQSGFKAEPKYTKLCESKTEDQRKLGSAMLAAINAEIESAIDGIVLNSEDLTEAERSAIDAMESARQEARKVPSGDPGYKAAQHKFEDARKQFRAVTSERRKDISDKIEKGEEISYTPECSTYAALPPGPIITISGELGWGGSSNGFEDYHFSGNGVIGGISGQVSFPIGGGAYTGFGGSVLGSGVSGSKGDPITSNIRLLVPIDGILGMTFAPNGSQWPLSIYGFGGLAVGDVNISASPFSATQTMGGWSIGVGADLQLSPTWSVGLKYRHFDLGNANFSVFPGGTSFVTERGDMVTGTLSYHFPISPPAPVAPMLTK
jgi:opacity protein-like surface antigen